MSMLILCTGAPAAPLASSFSAAEFDAAVSAALDAGAAAPTERKIAPGGRKVLIAEGGLARSTAEQILEPCELRVEPLLNEIPVRSFSDTASGLPAEKWLKKAASQRKAGDPRQPESRDAVIGRADALIRKLEEEGGDFLLISYPLFLTEFLDRLRAKGYVIQRSGLFRRRQSERIILVRSGVVAGGIRGSCGVGAGGF